MKKLRNLIILIKIPIYVLTFLISFLQYLLNFFYKIKSYQFDAGAFSHFASDYHFVKILSEKQNFKIIASVVGLNKYHNKYILRCIKREFIFNNFFFKYLDHINYYLPWKNYVRCYDFRRNSSMDLHHLLLKNRSKIHKFSKEEEDFCKKYLLSKGLKKNDKFVLFNLRDNLFYSKIAYIKDLISGTRNQINFQKCKKSLKMLSDKGYKIIRWGRFKKKIINFSGINIIDLAIDNKVPHIMDLWLAKNCSFAIGTATGPDPLVGHFQRPLLILGHWPIYYAYNFLNCLTLPPQAKWLNTKKHLTLKEMLDIKYNEIDINLLKKKKINFLGNSEKEINLSVKQILDIYEKKYLPKRKNEILQKKYWNSFRKWDQLTEKSYPRNGKVNKRFMIKKHPKSRIADIFLNDKKELFFKI